LYLRDELLSLTSVINRRSAIIRFAGSPLDVRKRSAFPIICIFLRGYASDMEAQPPGKLTTAGKAKPFRTSGGRAAPVIRE
jgi:hypothetical protein